jgi:hypothetical protein
VKRTAENAATTRIVQSSAVRTPFHARLVPALSAGYFHSAALPTLQQSLIDPVDSAGLNYSANTSWANETAISEPSISSS